MFLRDIPGFLHSLNEEKMSYEKRLLSGSVGSIEDYRFLTGVLGGYKECIAILHDHIKQENELKVFDS